MTGLIETLRPHSVSALLHAGLVVAAFLLAPVMGDPAPQDVVEVDIVHEVLEPPVQAEPDPPEEKAAEPEPPPPPPRPAAVPPKVAMKKVELAKPFHPEAEALETARDQPAEPDATESFEVPAEPPRFELSMDAVVEGGGGIQVLAVQGGSGRVLADPDRPGSPEAEGPPSPPTRPPDIPVAASWEITEEPEPLNDRAFKPRYPPRARARGAQATVVVRLWIDARGRVARARVVVAAGEDFDRAALKYCRKLRFRPAMANDTPVAARIDWTVEFRL